MIWCSGCGEQISDCVCASLVPLDDAPHEAVVAALREAVRELTKAQDLYSWWLAERGLKDSHHNDS